MDYGKEFEKYATKHLGISSLKMDNYTKLVSQSGGIYGLTPNIIEERQMNASVIDIFSRLMMDRIIFLGVPIYEDVANIIMGQLLFLESANSNRDIQIYINSPGGVVTSGMVMFDTMNLIKSPVHTICMGLAASMGSILLSMGEKGKRTIFPHGEVMIHQPSLGGYFQATSADIEIQAEQIRKTKELGAQILAKNCNKSMEQIMADFDRDYWMNAKEAVEYGIVDKIAKSL
jgi:ATP-dependent Clp protease protease subunit